MTRARLESEEELSARFTDVFYKNAADFHSALFVCLFLPACG